MTNNFNASLNNAMNAIESIDEFDMVALLNGYFGDKPVTSAVRKNRWSINKYLDENGHLMPFTKVMMAAMLTKPEWAEHPLVTAAMELKPVKTSVDDSIIESVASTIEYYCRYYPGHGTAIWTAYYTGQPVAPSSDEERDHVTKELPRYLDAHRSLLPFARTAMDKMVKAGRSPSREILGLVKVHSVTIDFPTAEAATAFLAKWRKDIGDGISSMMDKLRLKVAGV